MFTHDSNSTNPSGLKYAAASTDNQNPTVADDVLNLAHRSGNGNARSCRAFVLMGGLRGFSMIPGNQATAEIIRCASEYLYRMTEIALLHGAVVRRFTGDSFIAVFEQSVIAQDAQSQAVIAALEMQDHMNALNGNRESQGLITLGMGIGISSGTLIAGNMFSNRRMEYAVMGETAHVACFLQSLAETGKILATPDVIEGMDRDVRSLRRLPVPFRCRQICLEVAEIVGLTQCRSLK